MLMLGILLVVDVVVYGVMEFPFSYVSLLMIQLVASILAAILYFTLDFIVLNMVRHQVLLLDFPYILSGAIQWRSFLISCCMAVVEELTFRYFVLNNLDHPFLPLIMSSVLFGLVHIVFSRYDVVSKAILGLICGVIFIITGNIVIAILFHLVYNYFTLKEKNV